MGAVIPVKIVGLEGQVIKSVSFNEAAGSVRIVCDRDRRRLPVDSRTGRRGSVHRLLRRTVQDVPLAGLRCEIEIEYAETFLSPGQVRADNPSGGIPTPVLGCAAYRPAESDCISALCPLE